MLKRFSLMSEHLQHLLYPFLLLTLLPQKFVDRLPLLYPFLRQNRLLLGSWPRLLLLYPFLRQNHLLA